MADDEDAKCPYCYMYIQNCICLVWQKEPTASLNDLKNLGEKILSKLDELLQEVRRGRKS